MTKDWITQLQGAYIYYRDIYSDDVLKTGIDCKVLDQISAFNHAGLNCRYIYCSQPESLIGKVVSTLPLMPDGIHWPDPTILADINYLYIRQARFISKDLIKFLSKLKTINPNCVIFYELPEYPYDDVRKTLLLFSSFLKDKHNRKKLAGVLDYIVAISGNVYETIFNVPAICIPNGINLDRVPLRRPSLENDRIDILFAAYTVMGDNRYATDRILGGLQNYYSAGGDRNIVLHMAVGGSGIPEIRSQVKTHQMEDHVIVYGALSNEELGIVADKCGLGMATLGFHRVGIDISSAIKTRDYLARGLPFFYAGEVDLLMNDPVKFCLQIPADDSPVDIPTLIDFYDSIYHEYKPEELASLIRHYANAHASMNVTMERVFDAIRHEWQ